MTMKRHGLNLNYKMNKTKNFPPNKSYYDEKQNQHNRIENNLNLNKTIIFPPINDKISTKSTGKVNRYRIT